MSLVKMYPIIGCVKIGVIGHTPEILHCVFIPMEPWVSFPNIIMAIKGGNSTEAT